jgi:ABC-2 type transport system ATP-binding protein
MDAAVAPIRGVMLQDGGLPTGVSVERLLNYLAGFYAHPRPAGEVLEWLALGNLAGKVIRRLSGGEQRRVACAAALIGRPRVLLLDEPTAGLDPAARAAFYRVLAQQRDEGCTILFATHIYEDISALAESVLGMRDGRLVINDAVSNLVEGSEAIRFIGPRGLDISTLRQVLPADVEVVTDPEGRITVAATSPSVVATTATWCGANFISMETFSVGTLPLQVRIQQLLAESRERAG